MHSIKTCCLSLLSALLASSAQNRCTSLVCSCYVPSRCSDYKDDQVNHTSSSNNSSTKNNKKQFLFLTLSSISQRVGEQRAWKSTKLLCLYNSMKKVPPSAVLNPPIKGCVLSSTCWLLRIEGRQPFYMSKYFSGTKLFHFSKSQHEQTSLRAPCEKVWPRDETLNAIR